MKFQGDGMKIEQVMNAYMKVETLKVWAIFHSQDSVKVNMLPKKL